MTVTNTAGTSTETTFTGQVVSNNGQPSAEMTHAVIVRSLPYSIGITPDQAPTAAFTTSVNGLTVSFDGSGSFSPIGSIATYLWNFGDSSGPVTTENATTTHTYAREGVFSVSLTVTNTAGTSTETTFTGQVVSNNGQPSAETTHAVIVRSLPYSIGITPDQAPTAAFTTSINGLTVSFDGSGSSSPIGSIATYLWDFGDSSGPVTTENATTSHTYAREGVFDVSLTVTNTAGTSTETTFTGQVVSNNGQPSAEMTHAVIVRSLPYSIGITPDQAPTAAFTTSVNGLTVSFDGSGSFSPIGSIATYLWNFGDSSGPVTTENATTTHTYAREGVFSVSLTVTNTAGTSTETTFTGQVVSNNGQPSAETTHAVIVRSLPYSIGITPDQAPTAAFTTSVNGLTVSFDGSGSSSPIGSIATYLWDFGDSSGPVTTENATTSHTYAREGVFDVSLTVTNTAGTSTETTFTGQVVSNNGQPSAETTHPVIVRSLPYSIGITPDQAPTAVFTTSVNGLTVSFDGSGSFSPIGSIATYLWNFGDSSGPVTTENATTSHTYAREGVFSVSLTVTNTAGTSTETTFTGQVVSNNGQPSAETTHPVIVRSLPYSIGITPDQAPTAVFTTSVNGLTVSFDGSGSFSPIGSIATYLWDFGDSSGPVTTENATTSHTYAREGVFSVSLTVTNTAGTSTETTFTGQVVSNNGQPSAETTHAVIVRSLPYSIGITPDQAPTAAFTTSVNGLTVSFDGSGSSSPIGSIATYLWDFGDSSGPVTTENATTSHTYAREGVFDVSLTVTNTAGTSTETTFTGQVVSNNGQPSAETTHPVIVRSLPYSIGITPDQAPTAVFTTSVNGLTVSFDGSGSFSPIGSIATYLWDFGDSSGPVTTENATTSHTYAREGVFSVSLTVTNTAGTSTETTFTGQVVSNNGQPSAETTHAVIVRSLPYSIGITPDQAPTAAFTSSVNGLTVSFDGSGSFSPIGTIATYLWDFGDSSGPVTTENATTTHTYAREGVFSVSLTVTNTAGTSTRRPSLAKSSATTDNPQLKRPMRSSSAPCPTALASLRTRRQQLPSPHPSTA